MGAFDLQRYISTLFDDVERGPEDMHAYQNTAVNFLLENPYSALFIDLGLGKTCISLTAIMRLIAEVDDYGPWLVIAPRRVANETWPTEIRLWRHTAPLTYVHVREEAVVDTVNAAGRAERDAIRKAWWYHVGGASRALWGHEWALWKLPADEATRLTEKEVSRELADYMQSTPIKSQIEKARVEASKVAVRKHFRENPAVVHIVNREQVEFLVEAWGRDWPYKNVLIDESSCFKDHRTNRFKALRRVRPLIKRMHQLTATPAAETYMHLFAQIFLMDEGKRFGREITHFQKRYFTQNRYTYKWELRPGAKEEIAEKIADICLVMKAEDYLDLKKPVPLKTKIKLSEEQMALYRQMEKDMLVTLPSGVEIEAETAAALVQKLAQMTSGVIYETVLDDVGDGNFKKRRVVHHLHDFKIEKLVELVEEAQGEPLLVAYWHESSLRRLQKAFPKAVAMDKDGKCIKAWNSGKIPMLLVHPQGAGHGLNLQYGGRRIVLFDIPWSLELYLQLIGRLARQGQKFVVLIHHFIAEGTIDEDIVEALSEKRSEQELLFYLLKKIRRRMVAPHL